MQARYREKRRAKMRELEQTAPQLDDVILQLQQSTAARDQLKVPRHGLLSISAAARARTACTFKGSWHLCTPAVCITSCRVLTIPDAYRAHCTL